MSEESEEVLIQDGISSANWVEEDSFKITIH
jgi:hypothetical protein